MKTNEKRKVGRPVGYRAENPKNCPMPRIMLTEQQLIDYKALAKESGKTFSSWARDILDKEIKRSNK